ncbi:MAG: glycosyltransferase [bacterium]|nr:glycosyltransferase [bacterium]
MRILHVSCVSPPEIGGIGAVASREVAGLCADGFDAHLTSLNSHLSTRIGNAGRIYSLEHLVKNTDVVHLHYPFFGTDEYVARLKQKGVIRHLVVTFHMDADALGAKGLIFRAYRRLFQDRIMDSADAILVSSMDYAMTSTIQKWQSKMIEIPFGIDEQLYCPLNDIDSAQKKGNSDEENTILFVGGMDTAHAFKGVSLLLEALKNILNVKAILVGDGDLKKKYENEAKALGILDRVFFVGRKNEDELIHLYQSASVLAFPSTSRAEAFGLVALEAQSCGIPVVASDLPGVRTVVKNEETGILFPVGDVQALTSALNRLLSNPEQRKLFGREARKRVTQHFTWQSHLKGIEDVYTSICAS